MPPSFIDVMCKLETVEPGKREFANPKDGDAVVVTYNFMPKLPRDYRTDVLVDPQFSFQRYTKAQMNVVEQSLEAWSSVADVTFVKSSAREADLMFGKHNMPYKVNGYAGGLVYDLEENHIRGADIWLDWDDFVTTPFGRQIVTHEIGHALGLKHPYIGKGGLKAAELATTVMSYSLWGEAPYKGSPTKLGLIDAAALQSIYGPAQKKLGADTYKVGQTKLIWDGGGIDTLSAANAKSKAHLDMKDGSWNWIGKKAASILAVNQSWLGHFTDIENAIGSRFSDTIIGNAHDNIIKGGRGNDTITGGAGADTLQGGAGKDRFVFKSVTDMGTLERHDVIADFAPGDRIDLRKLGMTFLGTGSHDVMLSAGRAGQFYFHAPSQQLRIDSNGDGQPDHDIALATAAIGAESFIL